MKRKIFGIVFALALVLGFVLAMAAPAGAIPISTTHNVPGDYTTIQEAITAAVNGDTIQVDAGTYPETLNLLDKRLTIEGAGIDDTIVDASSFTGYAIQRLGNWSTIRNLKLIGTTGTSSCYGFKVSHVSNITLENIRVENSGKTGVDLNTVDGATLNGVTVVDTAAGFGVMMLDSNNIIVNNVATSGNAWGGVTVQTAGATSNNILFSGTFDVQEDNPLQLEQDPPTYFAITNITIPSQFTHIVYAFRSPDTYKQWFYQETLDDAKAFAGALIAAPPPPFTYSKMTIYDIAEENYYVIAGMKIQDAVNAASGTTINVAAGTFKESNITIDNSLVISGESRSSVVIAPASEDTFTLVNGLPPYFDAHSQQGFIVLADNVIIRNLTIDGNANAALTGTNNFRNGIINFGTQGATDAFGNLRVENVAITNVHYHGIALGFSGGPVNGGHTVTGCAISNIQYARGVSSYASNINVTNNTLDKMGMGIYQSPSPALPADSPITSTISNNILTNIGGQYSLNYGTNWPACAIYFRNPNNDATITIANNQISVVGPICPGDTPTGTLGIYLYNANEHSFVQGNIINTTGASGDSKNWGIYVGGCAGTTIQNNNFIMDGTDSGIYLGRGSSSLAVIPTPNVITNNTFTSTNSANTALSEGCAIVQGNHGDLFWMWENPYNTYNIITHNTISGFVCGILMHYSTTTDASITSVGASVNAIINYNSITGNTGYAIDASTLTTSVDATDNWWGSANGPTHAGNTFNVGSQGDAVSGNVDYCPWYDTDMTGASFAPVTTTAPVDSFASIQAGVNAASPGSTVNVAAGTYTEAVTINKSLTLRGAT